VRGATRPAQGQTSRQTAVQCPQVAFRERLPGAVGEPRSQTLGSSAFVLTEVPARTQRSPPARRLRATTTAVRRTAPIVPTGEQPPAQAPALHSDAGPRRQQRPERSEETPVAGVDQPPQLAGHRERRSAGPTNAASLLDRCNRSADGPAELPVAWRLTAARRPGAAQPRVPSKPVARRCAGHARTLSPDTVRRTRPEVPQDRALWPADTRVRESQQRRWDHRT
jgi:hypothetical protein